MERETKDISIDSHTFTVKTYASAREANAIQQALFKGQKVEMKGEVSQIAEFNTGALFEQEQELVRQMVVAVDGEPANVLEFCLDLPSETFNELVVELDALVSKKKS